MKIYDIDQAILNCVDMESGEIIDIKKFDQLQIERETKIDNLACWYKQLLAEAEAIKVESSNLSKRHKQKEEQAERLKNYISEALQGQKLETPRNRISWRKSEGIEIFDEDEIPDEYKVFEKVCTIDKAELKKTIKDGIKIHGAKLVEKNNIQIK